MSHALGDLVTLPRVLQPRARHLTYRVVGGGCLLGVLLAWVDRISAKRSAFSHFDAVRFDLVRDGPDETGELAGDGDDDFVFV